MKEYTCEEIKKEMEVLQQTFAVVRIVDPSVCRIMEFSGSGETLQLTPCDICYEVWNYSSQCTNCTSARALRRSETMSKCETCQNKIFNISAKPITVDGKPLVLEVVQPFSYTPTQLHSDTQKIIQFVSDLNQRILIDSETGAYNQEYLIEHLPNIFEKAKTLPHYNTALIRILNLSDIRAQYGQISVTGVVCFLYDLLLTTFASAEAAPLLVRKSEDSFFIAEKGLSYDAFVSRIEKLIREIPTQHLVFQNQLLPFEIEVGCADLSSESYSSADELFETLQKRL